MKNEKKADFFRLKKTMQESWFAPNLRGGGNICENEKL